VQTPEFNEDWFNPDAELPYGVEPNEVRTAIKEFYDFYDDLNHFLMREDHGRIETVLRANNALSDFIGNVATEELAQASDSLIINQKQDGFPDILPVDHDAYAEQDYKVHHGAHGIENEVFEIEWRMASAQQRGSVVCGLPVRAWRPPKPTYKIWTPSDSFRFSQESQRG